MQRAIAPTSSDSRPSRPPGAGLPRRIRIPRFLGLALGSLGVGAALWQRDAPDALWWAMALHMLAWPQVAYLLSSRSATPGKAEHRNLVGDCFFTSLWVPAIAFNLLPSVMMLAMVTMDVMAVGGPALLLRGLVAEAMGLGLGTLLFGTHLVMAPTLATLLACLPLLVVYPLTVGYVMHQQSVRLAERRRERERSERLYRDTLDAMEAAIVLADAQGRLVLCNDTFRRLLPGLEPLLQPGRTLDEIWRAALHAGLLEEGRGREDEWLRDRAAAEAHGEALTWRFAGERWRRVLDRRLPDGGLLSFSTDITDLVRREQDLQRSNEERDEVARQLQVVNQQLEQLSQTDALTGLANRRLLDLRLAQEWQRARRHGWWIAVVMLDVDHFKRFNDHHGHLEGDACLRRVATVLQRCAARTSDVVARYGGEEFVLVLPHMTEDEAAVVATRCLVQMDAEAIPHGASPLGPVVTLSVGLAAMQLGPNGDADPAALLRLADEALYRAKAAGRNRMSRSSAAASG